MSEVDKMKILEIVNEHFENSKVTTEQYDDDLSELGMDSINFIQIVVSLEDVFECEIPDSKLLLSEMNTVNKIYDVLASNDGDSKLQK